MQAILSLTVLSAASFVLVQAQSPCPKFQCGKADDPKFQSIEQCGYTDDTTNTVYVRKCSSGDQYCDPQDLMCKQSINPYDNLLMSGQLQQSLSGSYMKYPGDQCQNTTQCYRGECTYSTVLRVSTCVAGLKDATCSSHIDCNAGLFCLQKNVLQDGTCQPQIAIGQKCATSDICENNGLCFKGVCTRKRSLAVPSEIETQSQVELCYNRFAKKDNDGKLKCSHGWFIDSSHARRSTDSQWCTYYRIGGFSNQEQEKKAAVCGHSQKGQSYCPLREGDESFTRTLQLVKDYRNVKNECHYLSQHTCPQALKTEGVWAADASEYELKHYAQLQNVDSCLKEIFHTQYWQTSFVGSKKEVLNQYEDYNNAITLMIRFTALLMTFGVFLI